ncbi:MAG TPA: sulfite exporter TauE/SafE family protein [Gallionellaceae bacterium]|nr:sulfite exporter TauE/SafE family protein [Gallionellaceae bacterium]
MPELQWILYYLILGLVVGYFSGLFGIGGGLLLVPVLVFLFEVQHISAHNILHLALGTSMATILFTSLSSAYQHHAHNAVNWDTVLYITPGILLGTALGALIVGFVDTLYITIFFILFVYFSATQMLVGLKPDATRNYPGRLEVTAAGMVIGAISSIVSIGGGVLSVPYLVWHKQPIRNAIATSAAIGFPIAVGGTLGYIVTGYYRGVDLPAGSLGYVQLPVLLWLVIGTVLTAPLGAKATHRMPMERLRKLFALVLFVLATKMLIKLFA